ncbi:MAG: hypothetical protein WDM77_02850, partial [Steroidobacteraceae bacterium]
VRIDWPGKLEPSAANCLAPAAVDSFYSVCQRIVVNKCETLCPICAKYLSVSTGPAAASFFIHRRACQAVPESAFQEVELIDDDSIVMPLVAWPIQLMCESFN